MKNLNKKVYNKTTLAAMLIALGLIITIAYVVSSQGSDSTSNGGSSSSNDVDPSNETGSGEIDPAVE